MAVGVACVLCLYSFLGVFLALYKFVCVCVCARERARNNLKTNNQSWALHCSLSILVFFLGIFLALCGCVHVCVCVHNYLATPLRCKGIVVPCGSEGYSLCVSEHSSDANADPANIIIIT